MMLNLPKTICRLVLHCCCCYLLFREWIVVLVITNTCWRTLFIQMFTFVCKNVQEAQTPSSLFLNASLWLDRLFFFLLLFSLSSLFFLDAPGWIIQVRIQHRLSWAPKNSRTIPQLLQMLFWALGEACSWWSCSGRNRLFLWVFFCVVLIVVDVLGGSLAVHEGE